MVFLFVLVFSFFWFTLNYKKWMKEEIQVDLKADSVNSSGNRIITFTAYYPTYILPEMLTHRMFSRNTSSNRAIPFTTNVKNVIESPFLWKTMLYTHKGMQGKRKVGPLGLFLRNYLWWQAGMLNCFIMFILDAFKTSKQHTNRALVPWQWTRQIVTTNEDGLMNFFMLRQDSAAEHTIQEIANKLRKLYDDSIPKELKEGEYHIPFSGFDEERIEIAAKEYKITPLQATTAVAVARCARVSYFNFFGKDDYISDIKLYTHLVKNKHMSPLEHVAIAMDVSNSESGGNLGPGWAQLRKIIEHGS